MSKAPKYRAKMNVGKTMDYMMSTDKTVLLAKGWLIN